VSISPRAAAVSCRASSISRNSSREIVLGVIAVSLWSGHGRERLLRLLCC
jgi:hypothetical protein